MPVFETFSLEVGLETHVHSEIALKITKIIHEEGGIKRAIAEIMNVSRSPWAVEHGLTAGVQIVLEGDSRSMEIVGIAHPKNTPLNGHGDSLPWAQLSKHNGFLVFGP